VFSKNILLVFSSLRPASFIDGTISSVWPAIACDQDLTVDFCNKNLKLCEVADGEYDVMDIKLQRDSNLQACSSSCWPAVAFLPKLHESFQRRNQTKAHRMRRWNLSVTSRFVATKSVVV
jgi:hypothetical protein